MKKTITTLVLVFGVSALMNAQTTPSSGAKKTNEESNCYLKWSDKFKERGADDIIDGVYEDVIITFRSGSDADCFNGKCEVKEGKIIAMYIKKEDNSYEKVAKKQRYDIPITINNGMSKTLLTIDDELINVLFIKKIKAKKAGFVKAAEPTDD